MQFLKTLFWVVLAVILVIFAVNNWSPISVIIWQDVRIDTKLPVMVIGAFLIGFFPLWLTHRAMKWRLNRRIKTLETAARPVETPAAATPTPPFQSPPKPLDLSKEQITKPAPAPAVTPVAGKSAADDKANNV